MGHELAVRGVVLSDIGQEALLWSPLEEVEVLLKVIREKDPVIKVLVQLLQNLTKRVSLIHILDWEVLEKLPSDSRETAEDVQYRFSSTFADRHLLAVEVQPLPVLLSVVRGLIGKQGDVGVAQTERISILCGWRCCHRHGLQQKVVQGRRALPRKESRARQRVGDYGLMQDPVGENTKCLEPPGPGAPLPM